MNDELKYCQFCGHSFYCSHMKDRVKSYEKADDGLWELAKSDSVITREMLGIEKKREDEPHGIYYGI